MSEPVFQISAGALNGALKVARSVVEKRTTLPILTHILLEVADGELMVTASDLDVQFQQKLKVDQDAPFAAALPADKLTAFIAALAQDCFCKFAREADGRVIIRAGRTRITLPVLPVGDFPKLEDFDAAGVLEVPAATLSRLLGRTLPFVSKELKRYYLNGPLWHGDDGAIALASTNGHQMMRDSEAGAKWPDAAPEVILMPKACRVVMAACEGADRVFMQWSERLTRFTIGKSVITAKVIDGTFPDYRRVIPAKRDGATITEPDAIRGAISRLRAVADAQDNFVNFEADGEAMLISIRSNDQLSFAREAVPAVPGGAPGTSVNVAYFAALLEAVGGDSVAISQAGGTDPMRIERVVPDGAVAVLMPSRNFQSAVGQGEG